MPKIRTNRTKPPPEGFDEIEGILEDYTRKMRDGQACSPTQSTASGSLTFDASPPVLSPHRPPTSTLRATAESESHEGKRKTESLWPIMRITHTRSRYIYDLYYKREAISTELYDWLCKEQCQSWSLLPPRVRLELISTRWYRILDADAK